MRLTRILLTLLVLSCSFTPRAWAQAYNQHTWIVPGQPYLKIGPISQDGIHRITGQKLRAVSRFVSENPDVNLLHLYFRGQEVRMYVADLNSNSRLDDEDYIEFMGYENRGQDDNDVYRNATTGLADPTGRAHDYKSLFSPTTYVYLTWNSILRSSAFSFAAEGTPGNWSSLPQQTFFRHVSQQNFAQTVNFGAGSLSNIVAEGYFNSDYIPGEGLASSVFTKTTPFAAVLSTPGRFTGSANPVEVEARITNISTETRDLVDGTGRDWRNTYTLTLGSSSAQFIATGQQSNARRFNANISDLGSGTTNFTISIASGNNSTSSYCHYARLVYDRLTQFNGEIQHPINWTNTTNQDYHFRLQGMNLSGEGLVYDLTNGRRISGVLNGWELIAVVRKSVSPNYEMWATSTAGIQNISTNLTVSEALSDPLSEPDLAGAYVIITTRSYAASAEAYAQYRRQRFSTVVAYVDDIYDSFSYGSPTPVAYKRLMYYALNNWQTKPRFLLLWGPATEFNTGDQGVYTWGRPATDYEFVSNFTPATAVDWIPKVAVGRVDLGKAPTNDIAACAGAGASSPACRQALIELGNQAGVNYLDKVKEYEAQPYEPWMKAGLFFGGGANANEQQAIENTLRSMKDSMEACPYAGDGFQYQKRTTQTTANEEVPEVTEVINGGLHSIAFFGHSTSQRWDLDVLPPSAYKNNGRYPFVYAAGCYTGRFVEDNTAAEQWIQTPGLGGIGWLSNSDAGLLSELRSYMLPLYKKIYIDSLTKPVGNAIIGTMKAFASKPGFAAHAKNHLRQINYQGDPAVILHYPGGPDLVLEDTDVSFDPPNFGAETDSVVVQIVAKNLGTCFSGNYQVRIEQYNAQNERYTHPLVSDVPYLFSDTLRIKIRNQGIAQPGYTRYEICLDPLNSITETNETNNCVTLERYTPTLVPALVYPWPYAVINKQGITLKAATFGVTQEQNIQYIFEIDTVYEFSSPMRRTGSAIGNSLGGEWTLPAPYSTFTDSTVYYWRVRLANTPEVVWAVGSFQYINGSQEGWAQARPPQFYEDGTSQMSMNKGLRQWQFESFSRNVTLRTSNPSEIQVNKGECFNTSELDANSVLNANTLYIMGIDGQTLDCYGFNRLTGTNDFLFTASHPNNDNLELINTVVNSMPDGDYLAILGKRINRADLTPQFYAALQQLGLSTRLQTVTNEAGSNIFSFGLLGRKGSPAASMPEIYELQTGVAASLSYDLRSRLPSGTVSSTLIGPAASWYDLKWDWLKNNLGNTEDIRVSLSGQTPTGAQQLLMSDLQKGNYSLSSINAAQYPYLRLQAQVQDTAQLTAPQLTDWYVLYEELPDAAIDPYTNYSFQSDSLPEGAEVSLSLNVRNLSGLNMDSLLIRWQIRESNGTLTTLADQRGAPLAANQAAYPISYKFSTAGYPGRVTLIVTINPGFDQPEKFSFNNVYNLNFFVQPDRTNPILDVTFDGKRILDGDIVSPVPEIVVQLNDENTHFAITDPNSFELYFKEDDLDEGNRGPLISPNSAQVSFLPASLPENKARLTFKPDRLEDGDYVLTVNGSDVNGNRAGSVRYRVKFKVINESTVTDVLNYPNPFSTCTRFVYQLTGAEYPEVFQIQIYTVTGKLVRSIDLVELGEVFVGQHMTEYCWDGTDEFGDRLANGVYLYRVNLKLPGGLSLRKEDEKTAKYFKKGWGKLYIMR
jgi:hypothetical protein